TPEQIIAVVRGIKGIESVKALGGEGRNWGVDVEVARVAQVFIVDASLREQLEAEVRNEIRLRSDRSNLQAREEVRLAELGSESRVKEQQLAADRETIRRDEELEMTRVARQRRMETEALATRQASLLLEQQQLLAELEAEQARITAEEPVRRLRITKERELLAAELEVRRLQREVRQLDVETELVMDRARQAMRAEILPLEQAPRIVEAASHVLQGSHLSVYGDDAMVLGRLAPLFDLISRSVRQAVPEAGPATPEQMPLETAVAG
ncbi:MAG: hypothetical protein WCK58_07225, partial [Chloroflexota bacterium]